MSEHPPQRLLGFHLEHDPEARTVTVITITNQGGGEQVKHTVIGRYAEGDKVPSVEVAYLFDRGRFEAKCDVSVRLVEASAEAASRLTESDGS